MTEEELFTTRQAMSHFGGSFVAAMSIALSRADANNTHRIIEAFPDLLEQYGPETHFYRAMKEAQS